MGREKKKRNIFAISEAQTLITLHSSWSERVFFIQWPLRCVQQLSTLNGEPTNHSLCFLLRPACWENLSATKSCQKFCVWSLTLFVSNVCVCLLFCIGRPNISLTNRYFHPCNACWWKISLAVNTPTTSGSISIQYFTLSLEYLRTLTHTNLSPSPFFIQIIFTLGVGVGSGDLIKHVKEKKKVQTGNEQKSSSCTSEVFSSKGLVCDCSLNPLKLIWAPADQERPTSVNLSAEPECLCKYQKK